MERSPVGNSAAACADATLPERTHGSHCRITRLSRTDIAPKEITYRNSEPVIDVAPGTCFRCGFPVALTAVGPAWHRSWSVCVDGLRERLAHAEIKSDTVDQYQRLRDENNRLKARLEEKRVSSPNVEEEQRREIARLKMQVSGLQRARDARKLEGKWAMNAEPGGSGREKKAPVKPFVSYAT